MGSTLPRSDEHGSGCRPGLVRTGHVNEQKSLVDELVARATISGNNRFVPTIRIRRRGTAAGHEQGAEAASTASAPGVRVPTHVVEMRGAYYNPKHQVRALETLLQQLCSSESPGTPGSLQKPLALPRRIKRLSPDEESALIAAYRAGASIYELGDRFGIDRKTASRILHRRGVPMRRHGLSPVQVDDAMRLHAAGWTLKHIAHRLSVSTRTLSRRLREHRKLHYRTENDHDSMAE